MNFQKKKKIMEDSLELLMKNIERKIVEDLFDKMQEQEKDDNEEEKVEIIFILT